MKYSTFTLLCHFGDLVTKVIDVVAVDISAAVADVTEAYGEFDLVTWGFN